MVIEVPAYYYSQQGVDYSRPCPGETMEGWGRTTVPFDPTKTAILVMHAWKTPPVPGITHHVEYLQRANAIMRDRFPGFLRAVRQSGIRLIHVGGGFEEVLQTFPGYRRVAQMYPPQTLPTIEASDFLAQQKHRHWRMMGAKTEQQHLQCEESYAKYDFAIRPEDDEDMVVATNQLFALCRQYGIEHLIYTGFCVNACLTMSPCGFLDMTHHGLMCSVVGDLTTAVENKESCKTQAHRKYGLWQFAVQSGYVLLSQDLTDTLLKTQ